MIIIIYMYTSSLKVPGTYCIFDITRYYCYSKNSWYQLAKMISYSYISLMYSLIFWMWQILIIISTHYLILVYAVRDIVRDERRFYLTLKSKIVSSLNINSKRFSVWDIKIIFWNSLHSRWIDDSGILIPEYSSKTRHQRVGNAICNIHRIHTL